MPFFVCYVGILFYFCIKIILLLVSMINRVLIRLKIVQIIYAYYQNGGKNLDTAEKGG